jgi:hypothetical protein
MQMNAMETAAEAVCKIFDGLNEADKEAVTIRLVTLGSLHSGEGPDYIARVCEAAHQGMHTVLENKIAEMKAARKPENEDS